MTTHIEVHQSTIGFGIAVERANVSLSQYPKGTKVTQIVQTAIPTGLVRENGETEKEYTVTIVLDIPEVESQFDSGFFTSEESSDETGDMGNLIQFKPIDFD